MDKIDRIENPVVPQSGWMELEKWYKKNGRDYLPWRNNRTRWSILLAEVLLRRTRADTVAQVYPILLDKFPDAKAVLENKNKFKQLTISLGLPSRFDIFFSLCEMLITDFSGQVPVADRDLALLPGIGHYASDAIRCFGSGENRYIVDTNTIRIASRLTGHHADQSQHRSSMIRYLMNKAFGTEASITPERNFALLDLAAYVCKRSNPLCSDCPLQKFCVYGSTICS